MAQKVGYSQDWLKYTNYKQGPTTYKKNKKRSGEKWLN
jgi:hypothetical protein